LESLHVSYAYDTKTVQVLNRTGAATAPLGVTVRTWRPDGDRAGEVSHHLDPVPAGAVVDVVTIEPPAGVSGAWFLELELTEAAGVADPAEPSDSDRGHAVTRSRNVYWLSSTDDVLDRASTTWHSTAVSQFADLRALDSMRSARVRATARAVRTGADLVLVVTLCNEDPSNTPAVALHTSVTCGGEPLTPVLWDDNDVTLFTGQTIVLTGRPVAPEDPDGPSLQVQVDGFNLYGPLVLPLTPGSSAE
jgi:exo-1,4-beta-D-glucosaminidase